MDPDQGRRREGIQAPAPASDDQADRISRLRAAMSRLDTEPSLLSVARGIRRRLPGDEKFGDPLSTAGRAPVEMIARGVSALQPGRESVTKELGLSALQVWQSVSEATGRGRGDLEMALLFTDLVGFSSWALHAGDAAVLELLRRVGTDVEAAIVRHDGRIVKRLGDGLMATFLSAEEAVEAALEAQDAVEEIQVDGYVPRMRAGVHWGRPRKLGGDLLGVDVNVAARVAARAKAGQVLVSDALLARIDRDGMQTGRAKRLRADGAPSDLRVSQISRVE
ncbi:MAG TPA: adenylate/guanylate cyclase domain-containing protein [Solirubrobacteraceae bacterium]|nr:adenylate/guanylate cyclase domain-containing protein [Solirubrobacteraceae bacterium]